MSVIQITKRDGKIVPYDKDKIFRAISSANEASVEQMTEDEVVIVTNQVEDDIQNLTEVSVEQIQDIVEHRLMSNGFFEIAKKYIMYRQKHTIRRNIKRDLMETYKDVLFTDSAMMDFKRENANINTDSPMGIMLKLGTEGSKHFIDNMMPKEFVEMNKEDWCHIHDQDFALITLNCCQIDLLKLFHGGFSTGHGHLREPNSIRAYSSLACIAIQSNQNDMFGGQSISAFDYAMAEGIKKSFYKAILNKMYDIAYLNNVSFRERPRDRFFEIMKETISLDDVHYSEKDDRTETKKQNESAREETLKNLRMARIQYFTRTGYMLFDSAYLEIVYDFACRDVEEETHQAMEAAIHNFCSLHSRAGSQTPFSSINFGMDTSPEGRLATRETLNAINAGLGNGETAIFPISIFQIKDGVNYNEGDINYDLFKLACKVSAKRLFPNFLSLDASFNLPYYKPGDYNSYIASMGCRTRVMGNVNGPEVSGGRGNFSFVTINLPKLALEAKLQCSGNNVLEKFYELFDKYITLGHDYLLYRLQIIADKHVYNFPFLMGQGVWLESENLRPNDTIRDLLKHASYSIGFCGLAECLIALTGKHHGEDDDYTRKLGLEIIRHLRTRTDKYTKEEHMNWTTFSSPAESVAGKFQKSNRKRYGIIKGVTDRDYLTNSYHIPPYYKINAFEKIAIEAPYHSICNAGHISYIEMDGDPTKNLDAFEKIVRSMHDADMGYFSINHPIDRDPICGYTGIIENECPHCHRHENGIYHDRIKAL